MKNPIRSLLTRKGSGAAGAVAEEPAATATPWRTRAIWLVLSLLILLIIAPLAFFCLFPWSCAGRAQRAQDRSLLIRADELRETDVLPHCQGAISPDRNYVYCAAFQLAWDGLRQSLSDEPVGLEGDPDLAAVLNQSAFDRASLSATSYLAMAGRADQGIVESIRRAMADRFSNATLQVPDPPGQTALYAYAYLAKEPAFREAFERLAEPLEFGSGPRTAKVAAFGTERFGVTDRDDLLCRQVTILDYRSSDDFILSLHPTSQHEQIILAKTQPKATLGDTMDAVRERIDNASIAETMRRPMLGESLRIPLIAVGAERPYHELTGKRLRNRGWEEYYVAEARQGIRFRLDERGARLESRSGLAVKPAAPVPDQPRHFVFDKPFLLYMKETSAPVPYFAIWVATPEILEEVR